VPISIKLKRKRPNKTELKFDQ